MFSRVVEQNPGAVVTEYAWSADSCDPCPTPPLGPTELATLGADVLPAAPEAGSGKSAFGYSAGFTLTRLHARYTKDSLGEDLVFQQAPPIAGGRGIPDEHGALDQKLEMLGTSGACQFGCGADNFQGRYVILHPWDRGILCTSPQRGAWGGPDGMDSAPMTKSAPNSALSGAAPVAGDLGALVAESVPALKVKAKNPTSPLESDSSCAVAGAGAHASHAGWFVLAAVGMLVAVRRRKRSESRQRAS
jgi:MYXO-CTERM domain-containing protein